MASVDSCALTRNKGVSCYHFQIMFMWYSHIFCNSAPSVSYSLAQEGREQLHWCVPSFSCFFLSERKAQHETPTEWFPFLLQMISLPTSSEMVSNHHASVCCFFFIKTQYLTCMCSFLNVPMFMCYPSPFVTSISWLQSHSCLHSALSCCNRRIFLVVTKQGSNGLDLGFSMGCIKWSVGTADVSTCVVNCGCLFVYF